MSFDEGKYTTKYTNHKHIQLTGNSQKVVLVRELSEKYVELFRLLVDICYKNIVHFRRMLFIFTD